jgi:hypothetical protein
LIRCVTNLRQYEEGFIEYDLVFKFACSAFPLITISPSNSPLAITVKAAADINTTADIKLTSIKARLETVTNSCSELNDTISTINDDIYEDLNQAIKIKDALPNLYALFQQRKFLPYARGGLVHGLLEDNNFF